ncbi:hypothetical protein SDC9_132177 [bioreactor metagenome]|uniref:Cell shape-determining protein MreC n=1 Tax=bioreactor metagenome TaxID=1076179 RepID=A0A645D6F4_9ZZZZ
MYKLLKLFNDFKDYFIFLILIIVSLSLISINSKQEIGGFRAVIIGGVGYIQKLFSWIPNQDALRNSNKTLIELNIQLSKEVAMMRKALHENNELRSMLNIVSNSQYKLIPCDVTSKRSIQMRNFATINKGTADSIQVGMSVCSEAGLVGIITSASEHFAMVELLNNRNIKIPVVSLETRLDGILKWEGDEYLYMQNISKSSKINVGEIITTSLFSSKYPNNITVGKIVKVAEEPGSYFSKIYVEPACRFFNFSQLFVINYVPNPEELGLLKEFENEMIMIENAKKDRQKSKKNNSQDNRSDSKK